MANALLRRAGRFGAFVLVPMQVPSGTLPEVVGALRRIGNFTGAIVSMPHKTAVVSLLDRLTLEAQRVGAVNVIRRTADGRLEGSILDGEGFVSGLRSAGHEVAGRSCLLVGAGGAAAAIAFSLARNGCRSLAIQNRTTARAATLATRLHRSFPALHVQTGDSAGAVYDIAINATSLGMKPDDALPI